MLNVSLDSIAARDRLLAGGKGASLAQLLQADFSIPQGWVLTTKAFNLFIEHNQLTSDVSQIRVLLGEGNMKALVAHSIGIQDRIMTSDLPQKLKDEINSTIQYSEECKWAIRSSAVGEDSSNDSFAGIHESILDVDISDILSEIKKCYASLFSQEALFYRYRRRINASFQMAVVIQRMIPSVYSGVVFTRDPLSQDNIIIEIVKGQGTYLVSGLINPYTLSIPRNCIYGNTERFANAPLKASRIQSILCQSIAIEQLQMGSCDIEFAVTDDNIFFLQSRPALTPA